jgi:hypothetical protein
MSDLFLAETDLTRASARIADGENCHGMSFATVALRTAGAVMDDPFEKRAAENVPGIGKTRGEAIALTDDN